MIVRRTLALLAGLARPGLTRAQGRSRPIGLLMASAETDPDGQARVAAFAEALAGLGWAEGHLLRLDRRWAAGSTALFRAHAAEMVAVAPDLLLADGTPSVAALLRETRSLPLVFVRVGDPVGSGFVESLARPGGNATGFTAFDPLMGPKWMEFLKEAVPGLAVAGLLFNPETAPHVGRLFLGLLERSARDLGLAAAPLPVHGEADIAAAIGDIASRPGGALVAMPDIFLVDHRAAILAHAARHRLPAVYTNRLFAEEGGLMSYGFPVLDAYRQAGAYADRILRGARPADLPVQTPTNWQLTLNLRAARALSLSLAPALLARATEVIE